MVWLRWWCVCTHSSGAFCCFSNVQNAPLPAATTNRPFSCVSIVTAVRPRCCALILCWGLEDALGWKPCTVLVTRPQQWPMVDVSEEGLFHIVDSGDSGDSSCSCGSMDSVDSGTPTDTFFCVLLQVLIAPHGEMDKHAPLL